jgi:hypothetical protein
MLINIRKVALAEATVNIELSTMEFVERPQRATSDVGAPSDPGDNNESV